MVLDIIVVHLTHFVVRCLFFIVLIMPDHPKYSQTVTLFRHTELSRKEICTICNLTLGEFSAHLQRYHRDLIITRLKINSNLSNGEIISSAIFCSNLASDGKLGERSVAGYMTADALPSRTRDG